MLPVRFTGRLVADEVDVLSALLNVLWRAGGIFVYKGWELGPYSIRRMKEETKVEIGKLRPEIYVVRVDLFINIKSICVWCCFAFVKFRALNTGRMNSVT